jgi:hydroxymethylpyrimidine pyrophosphatase-like HAD family hydrolase
MSNLYFITDLDRTIIHAKNKGFKCVEKEGEKEITYMTEDSYKELMKLLSLEHFKFIPCTMRNLKQTMRVDFIREYDPKIIICTNGAQIYIDGQLDTEWDKEVRKLVDKKEVIKYIQYIESLNLDVEEVRNIEDFYITIKCEDVDKARAAYEILKDRFAEHIRIIQMGFKVFIINKNIDKLHAVDYIIDKFEIENLFTAGDSEPDRCFTRRGISILPKHCSFSNENAIVTEKSGIYATDDLIDILKRHIVV